MDSDKLFSEVKFFMAQCNGPDEIKDILIAGGARHINYLSEQVTHVIADSNCPEAEEAVDLYDKPVVTSLWVHLCSRVNRLLPAEAFSPNRRIFHNVVASFSSDLSRIDIEVLAATLTFYGARLTKELENATHFIAISTKPREFQPERDISHRFKLIAPDWVLESVKQGSCLDETLFEPGLLLGPPPPPPPKPPTPLPITNAENISKNNDKESVDRSSTISNNDRGINISSQAQSSSTAPQQKFQNQPQPQFDINGQPRMRPATNIPRTAQPRFRQILPQNIPQGPRPQVSPQPRMAMIDSQQPMKHAADYNHAYRKVSPYQPSPDMQPMPQQQQSIHSYQPTQHQSMHQQGAHLNQSSRMPQTNIFQQPRPQYQNNQMHPRLNMPQTNMMNQQPLQPQPINHRLQDPSSQMSHSRPYQVAQNQPINAGYQQGMSQRQPLYYNQNQNMSMRMAQQGPPTRIMMQGDHVNHDGFSQPVETIQTHPQYQTGQQTVYQQHPRQQVPSQAPQQFQPPHPPVSMHTRPQLQPNIPGNIRGSRNNMLNQQDVRANIRQPTEKPSRAPRAPVIQTQSHPSIFDSKQESNYAQMKAKVPILTDDIQYFDHDNGSVVPEFRPFSNCVFKLVEHTNVNPKLVKKWLDAIVDAGGKFSDKTEELTHLICESRSTSLYSEAIKKGIRCVTIYWINDVLAEDLMTYPWKALHIPTPFMQADRPLQNQIISITNFKGRERREVKEMIMKTGATSTEYFSQSNTLLICGRPGGEKYERAIEWRIPVANCQLLSDFLISGRNFSQMLAHAKYQNFNRGDQLRLDSYVLVRDLLRPWTKPVPQLVSKGEGIANNTNGTLNLDSSRGVDEEGKSTFESNNSNKNAKTELSRQDDIEEAEAFKEENSIKNKDKSSDVPSEKRSKLEPEDMPTQTDLKETLGNIDVDMKIVPSITPSNIDFKSANDDCQRVLNLECGAKESQTLPEVTSDENSEQTNQTSSNQTIPGHIEKPSRASDEPVRILFTHLEAKLVRQLETYSLKLGLSLAGSPVDCTHLVVDQISRTPKFICAFSHAKFILSYKWLIESQERGEVLDEKAFILQDSEGERKFSFNLVHSLLKRKKRKSLLFTNFIFFVTPTVLESVKNLKEMIESAGGKMTTRKLPTLAQLNHIQTCGKRFVIITSQQDLHLCSSAEQIGVDLLRVEFVISGILRQDIEIDAHRISLSQRVKESIEKTSQSSIVAPSPSKKLRSE